MPSASTQNGKPSRTPRLAVALPDSARSWVDQVAVWMSQPPAATAASLIEILADLLRIELRRVPLSVAEADAVSHILGNAPRPDLTVSSMRVFVEASEAFDVAHQIAGGQSSYAATFGIDENSLLEKLRRLTPTADLALRLALAQGRQQQSKKTGPDNADAADHYRATGITIIDNPGEKP